jgi:hypothetical protein
VLFHLKTSKHSDCSAEAFYLLPALQLRQHSAGNPLALLAGACCRGTRPAAHPLFPVKRTSANTSQLGKQTLDATEH